MLLGRSARGRVLWCLSIVLGVMAAAVPAAQASAAGPAARTAPASARANGTPGPAAPARRCRTVSVPVTIPGAPAGQITGDLCAPATGPSQAVLLLAGGGGENADYWNLPALPSYSLVRAAAGAGYATFAIDRLGTGRSTYPSPSTLVTYDAEVSTVHQVAAALHDRPALFGRTWRTVVGVGHSLGSGTLAGVAAGYPHDLSALILTGYGATVTAQTLALGKVYQQPAASVDPAKWSGLDPGYLTEVPSGIVRDGLVYPPATTRAAASAAARAQGTLSGTELATRPQGTAAIAQGARITVPVLVADGQYDSHYCESNAAGEPVTIAVACSSQQAFYSYQHGLLSGACLATDVVAGSGHAIEFETGAPAANRTFVTWLNATVHGGTARCAASGVFSGREPAASR